MQCHVNRFSGLENQKVYKDSVAYFVLVFWVEDTLVATELAFI